MKLYFEELKINLDGDFNPLFGSRYDTTLNTNIFGGLPQISKNSTKNYWPYTLPHLKYKEGGYGSFSCVCVLL